MKGDSVTLVYDCITNETMPLNRTFPPTGLNTDGVIFLSRRLLENDIFEVRFKKTCGITLC